MTEKQRKESLIVSTRMASIKYAYSLKGKISSKRWRQSAKGKATLKRIQAKYYASKKLRRERND